MTPRGEVLAPAAEPSYRGRARAREVARRLDEWVTSRAWAGTDPYEGLNGTRFTGPLKRTPIGRRVLMQAVKRSPLDLRPLLGIKPEPNAASVAWLVSAYSRRGFLPRDEADDKLDQTLRLLLALRSPGRAEPCWGYHFDYQSRVLFMPRRSPNTIATSYAGMALLDAYERSGDTDLLALAEGAARFFVRHVPQTPAAPGAHFGYAPADRSPIHNANMHVAALLARVAHVGGAGEELTAPARRALEYTLARQRPDGSWPYGERADLGWTDGFHTGYVLDALRTCADADLERQAAEEAWVRGLDFYSRELILDDGTPKYSTSSVYPLDAQSAAQAIQTFAIAAAHLPPFSTQAWKVFDFAMKRLRRPDGLFLFQRGRLWRNSATHVRWVIAPMLLALTHLLGLDETDPPVSL